MAEISNITDERTVQPEHRPAVSCVAHTDLDQDDEVFTITDDLPYDAAISSSEIDAIERYMSDILDVVLGSCAANATTKPKSPEERMR